MGTCEDLRDKVYSWGGQATELSAGLGLVKGFDPNVVTLPNSLTDTGSNRDQFTSDPNSPIDEASHNVRIVGVSISYQAMQRRDEVLVRRHGIVLVLTSGVIVSGDELICADPANGINSGRFCTPDTAAAVGSPGVDNTGVVAGQMLNICGKALMNNDDDNWIWMELYNRFEVLET